LLPARSLAIEISNHAVVDEKSPFVLYILQIQTDFSRFVTKKKFENFVELQTKLLSLRDQVVLEK